MFFKYNKGGFNTDCIEGFKDKTDYITTSYEMGGFPVYIKTPDNLLTYKVEVFTKSSSHTLYNDDAKRFLGEFLKSEMGE